MKNTFFSSTHSLALAVCFFLIFGCNTEDVVPLPEDGQMPTLATIVEDGPLEDGEHGQTCECYYQILSVATDPAPGGGDPNGGPDYYFFGGLPGIISGEPIGCIGTANNCSGEQCLGFSAYGSINPNGCQCFDPINCDDFIYDDYDNTNGATYPTQFFPFNCGMPLFSEIKIVWESLWYSPTCTGQHTIGQPSSLTFRIMCIDPSPLPPECELPGQANVSPPITLTMTELSQYSTGTTVELIDCGCEPVEQ